MATFRSDPTRELPENRFRLLLEIGAVITLGVLPHLLSAVWPMILVPGLSVRWNDPAGTFSGIIICLQILLPLLYIMWRSGRGWAYFGVIRPHLSLDLVLSLAYIAAALAMYYALAFGLGVLGSVLPVLWRVIDVIPASAQSYDTADSVSVAFIVWMVLNGLCEELVTKGFMIPRLIDLCGSRIAAVLVAAGMFASYHIYQGSYAVLVIFIEQVVFGFLFLKVRRIWPFAIGHAGLNVVNALIW